MSEIDTRTESAVHAVEAGAPAEIEFIVTESLIRRKVEEAISFWCDPEDITPLTKEHLTREIVLALCEDVKQIS